MGKREKNKKNNGAVIRDNNINPNNSNYETQLLKACFDTEMRYAGGLLQVGGIDISKLTPYGPDGIAIRGELDYKEENLKDERRKKQ